MVALAVSEKKSSSGGTSSGKRKSMEIDSDDNANDNNSDEKKSDEGDNNDVDKKAAKAAKKAAKKAKKEKRKSSSPPAADAVDPASMTEWRKTNKIVLRDSRPGEEGAVASKALQKNSIYYPLTSFDACKDILNKALIHQCVKVNGFAKPSPIQAQCWVRHDVVIHLELIDYFSLHYTYIITPIIVLTFIFHFHYFLSYPFK